MSIWLLIVACSSAPVVVEPPVVEVPVVAPVEAPPPPVEEPAPGGVRVLHTRMSKRALPQHVSATWVDSGLQVMITGLNGQCAPVPEFAAIVVGNKVRLMEAPAVSEGECKGFHTVMMQLDGQTARDVTVEVVRSDGEAFADVEVKGTDH